jgi:hypothetical protein
MSKCAKTNFHDVTDTLSDEEIRHAVGGVKHAGIVDGAEHALEMSGHAGIVAGDHVGYPGHHGHGPVVIPGHHETPGSSSHGEHHFGLPVGHLFHHIEHDVAKLEQQFTDAHHALASAVGSQVAETASNLGAQILAHTHAGHSPFTFGGPEHDHLWNLIDHGGHGDHHGAPSHGSHGDHHLFHLGVVPTIPEHGSHLPAPFGPGSHGPVVIAEPGEHHGLPISHGPVVSELGSHLPGMPPPFVSEGGHLSGEHETAPQGPVITELGEHLPGAYGPGSHGPVDQKPE